MPYAKWLMKNDKYEEALRAFRELGAYEQLGKMLTTLSDNAIVEKRYEDAGQYFWVIFYQFLIFNYKIRFWRQKL